MRCVTVPADRSAARRDFLRLPRRVYAGDPHWVPPVLREVKRTLDVRRNPYFRHAGIEAFVTYRGDTPLARATLVTDRRRVAAEGIAQFGYFEACDDAGAAKDPRGGAATHSGQNHSPSGTSASGGARQS